jgi:NAD(P)-dependent dehydrogenase (short-subunit alcohol dehydrogenase family)
MKDFTGKVIVITGAGSGIGRALAEAFDALGARLALADVNSRGLEETRAGLKGTEVLLQALDVADRGAVQSFRDAVLKRFGVVDVVINNAGVSVSQTVEALTYEDFEWIMNINFWGVVHGSKAFLPDLNSRPEAALINVSSVFGLIAVPSQGAYNATKFAVRGFTEALRHEMRGGNLLVMCVHPGGIRTNIARSARFYQGSNGETDAERAASQFEKIARTTPRQAARTIIQSLRRNEVRCLIGTDAHLIDRIQRWLPVGYWNFISALLPKS